MEEIQYYRVQTSIQTGMDYLIIMEQFAFINCQC